jgi:hypothetical protein
MGLCKPKEPGSSLAPNENGNDVTNRIRKRRVSVETLNKNGLDPVSRILKRKARRERLVFETPPPVKIEFGPIHLYDISYGQCRWVIGDPTDMMFCAHKYEPTAVGLSFCKKHMKMGTHKPYR